MRASRAYIAGLGTTGVLIAFALLVLALVGALLSFNAWPGEGSTAEGGALEVGDGQKLIELDPVGFAGGPDAVAAAAAARRASGARGGRVVVRSGGVGGARGGAANERQAGEGNAPGRPGGGDQGGIGHGVGGAAEGLGGTTESVTRGAGEALGRVDSGLGREVTERGAALGEAVEKLETKTNLPSLP